MNPKDRYIRETGFVMVHPNDGKSQFERDLENAKAYYGDDFPGNDGLACLKCGAAVISDGSTSHGTSPGSDPRGGLPAGMGGVSMWRFGLWHVAPDGTWWAPVGGGVSATWRGAYDAALRAVSAHPDRDVKASVQKA